MTGAARIGVLVAAGRSRRMGRPKPLLPWPPGAPTTTLVAAAFDAIAPVCDAMIVVTGHEEDAVTEALAPRAFRVVPGRPDGEMIDSIRLGLAALRDLDAGASAVLHPADHPAAGGETLAALVAAADLDPGCAVMPEHGGRGGHPVLIPAAMIPEIIASRAPGGLRRFWIDHHERCVRIPVNDASVVEDVDRPEDYEARR